MVNKKIAAGAISLVLLAAAAIPSLAQFKAFNPYRKKPAEKTFLQKYGWYIAGGFAVVGGIAYSNEQKRLEDERKRAEEQARYTADSDGDGMLDYLEQTYFGSLDQPADGDYDNDGYSNLLELNRGSNPDDGTSIPGDDWHDLSVSGAKACSISSRLEDAVTINAVSREIGFAVPVRDFYLYGTKSLTSPDFKLGLAYKFR